MLMTLIFGATSESLCQKFEKVVGHEFEMSMMGELKFFLRLQIKQTPQGTMTYQEKYIKEMLKKFNMDDAKPIDIPIGISSKWTLMKLVPSE